MHEKDQLNWQRDNFENINEAWEGDLWDRKRLGEQLTNYVDRLQCGAVLALDARWGEGKTWFVRHWKKHLEDEKHNVIYLDAFANDYLDDPFLVISSEITSCLSKDCDLDQKHIDAFKGKAAAAYHALLPSLPKVLLTLGLNLISGGVLGTAVQEAYKVGEKVVESATDEIGDKIKESIEEKIEAHEADKNTLLAFKQQLSQLAEDLDKPLVFIIDELDRCRPDFSIRLIERIKHFFDIPKIVFILVVNKPQFVSGIRHIYGYGEDESTIYLEKFVDFEIPLISNKSIQESTKNAYEIVAKNFISIGEDCSDIHFIFHQAVVENLNNRELKRKINIYALLKTKSIEKNIFLALAIASNKRDLLRKLSEIYVRVVKLESGNQNISAVPEQNYDIEKFRLIVNEHYKIELKVVVDFYSEIKELMVSKTQYHIHNYVERRAEFLNKYALSPVNNMDDHLFLSQYLNYLKTNFDTDD
ncbi:P-loop NTPase fold protein [Acinetobacter sp. A1-4-2]|uniref:P-loop NTPase fold protein n=1 Tax=Acinetobacter sp. A1-4-2 TaxID=3156489 RepID=A0AAU7SZE2_9GAMM